MSFSFVSIKDLGPEAGDAVYFNIFDTFGTTGCHLDCNEWQKRQRVSKIAYTRRDMSTTEVYGDKKERGAIKRQFAKSAMDIARSEGIACRERKAGHIVSGKTIEAKQKRKPFTLGNLEESCENGCGSCRFIKAFLLPGIFSEHSDLVLERLVLEWTGNQFFLRVHDKHANQTLAFQFFSPTGAKGIVAGMPSSNVLNGDTSSASSFDRASQWIEACETQHEHCGVGRDVPLPKRLIDLDPIQNADNEFGVKLAETENLVGTYASLSHCWGKEPMPMRTLEATIEPHKIFMPWKELPRTFQDAANISRRLGIRYLWIDSLCIIQDSTDDWQIESAKMANIYRNSFITIAAAAAGDFRGGCFARDKIGDTCFHVQGDDVPDGTVIGVRDSNGLGWVHDESHLSSFFTMFTRAWIFQERLLSRRVLYFNHGELQLECRQGLVCECDNIFILPHASPKTRAGMCMQSVKKQYFQAIKSLCLGSPGDPVDTAALNNHWQKAVMQYSKLHLTYPGDKLPALSGCAKDFGSYTGDQYLAGIWRHTFVQGMLWTVLGPVTEPRPTWRAPSWSWASVDTPFGLHYNRAQSRRKTSTEVFLNRIQSIDCVPDGKDNTGAVKSASLRLKSSLRPVYVRRVCRAHRQGGAKLKHGVTLESDMFYSQFSARNHARSGFCNFSVPRLKLKNDMLSLSPDFRYDRTTFGVNLDPHGPGSCRLAEAFLLHLFDSAARSSGPNTHFFLLLRKIASSGEDHFERTGLVTMVFSDVEQADRWFEDVFRPEASEEKAITIN